MTIPWAKPHFDERARRYLADALDSTWVSHGPYVVKFEETFARRVGARFGITTSNGTTALHLAFLALGIGPGDEVIVPGFSFVAPGNMALAVGAAPVFADVDRETWCLDPASVERCITARTRAVVAVHTYGNACDMDALREIARRRRLRLVEDVAEACFTKHRGRELGTLGDIGCFSFQATKTISMGEGGFVTTDDEALHERMRLIRDHGMRKSKRYWHDAVGFNFRLTNLQAAIGYAQLEQVEDVIAARVRVDRFYRDRLASVPGVVLQVFKPEVEPVVWAFAFRCDARAFGCDRDALMKRLAEKSIETRPGFHPFASMPLYEPYVRERPGIADEVGASVISLPSFPTLTDGELAEIGDAVERSRVA